MSTSPQRRPVFVLAGLIAFNRGSKTRTRDLGRVAIGIGLILLALHLIIATIQPVEQAKRCISSSQWCRVTQFIDVAIAAILTWVGSSASLWWLLIMTLAADTLSPRPPTFLLPVLDSDLGDLIHNVHRDEPGRHAGCTSRGSPNELWCADYKGEFKLGQQPYCSTRSPSPTRLHRLGRTRLDIKEVDDGIWLVTFIDYDLGYIDLEKRNLQPIDNPFGPRLSPMS